MACSLKPASPFRYFNSSPEIIRLAVLMYVRGVVSPTATRLLSAEFALPRHQFMP